MSKLEAQDYTAVGTTQGRRFIAIGIGVSQVVDLAKGERVETSAPRDQLA